MVMPPKRIKLAAPPPRRSGANVPTRTPAGQPAARPTSSTTVPHRGQTTSQPVSGGNSTMEAVKEMQRAILAFADVASSTDVTSMQGNQSGRQTGDQSRMLDTDQPESRDLSDPADEHKEHLGGSDPFGNFLIQQYVVGDPVGKQYLNVDVAGKQNRQNSTIDDTSLRGVIDSIKRLGSPGTSGGEKSVDGIWAYRTDNAIKNVYAIANAMFNFAKDLKVPSGYSQDNLEAFKKEIPAEYTQLKDPNDKIKRAKAITEQVKAITSFFQSLKSSVLNNRDLRQYIDQKKPFVQYKKENTGEALKPNEQALLQSNVGQAVPGIKLPFVKEQNKNWISFNELKDMEAFKGFIKRVDSTANIDDPNEVKKYLDQVNQALQSAKT